MTLTYNTSEMANFSWSDLTFSHTSHMNMPKSYHSKYLLSDWVKVFLKYNNLVKPSFPFLHIFFIMLSFLDYFGKTRSQLTVIVRNTRGLTKSFQNMQMQCFVFCAILRYRVGLFVTYLLTTYVFIGKEQNVNGNWRFKKKVEKSRKRFSKQ